MENSQLLSKKTKNEVIPSFFVFEKLFLCYNMFDNLELKIWS